MSTEPDRDDRSSEAQSTGGSDSLEDPAAVDPPVAGPSAADPMAAGVSAPEPTPVIPVSESSFRQPPGTALPAGQPADAGSIASRPEVLAGAAFAGGLAVAMLIRRALN
ncbi:MAG: hypothetical protein MSC31_13950 [Solirubrobacteraceae bacterium MAG38_C4-C5]|nr:hypothetical protein [Candidatus Siliceabacter maunaloa]